MINEKRGHVTHSAKMGIDKLVQNTPQNLSAKIVCPSSRVLKKKGFIGRPWSMVQSLDLVFLSIQNVSHDEYHL